MRLLIASQVTYFFPCIDSTHQIQFELSIRMIAEKLGIPLQLKQRKTTKIAQMVFGIIQIKLSHPSLMSFRVRDIQAVHNNPLNDSVSKHQYSIPKAERFRNIKSELSYKYYDLPSTNDRKAPSFGVSSRPSPFSADRQIPPPNKYTLKDMVIQKKQITFPKGREQCKTNSFLKTNSNPGPGTYNPNPEFIEESLCRKYSFRAKTEYSHLQTSDMPGPGKYTIKQPWLEKQKVLSIDRKYGAPLMREGNHTSKIKVNLQNLKIPYYNATKTSTGCQTFNKTGGFSIGKSRRFSSKVKTEAQVPGPGYYPRFSQFI